MKKALSILLLLTSVALNIQACLNLFYSLDKEGNLHFADEILIPFNKNFNKQLTVQNLNKLKVKLEKEKSYMLLSDYSICLIKLGKEQQALEILVELYNHYPSEYRIASNLGTAYELNGKVDSALKYIKRGLELNPKDHEGSEWIHVKILETKLILKQNPNYLIDHTVLQLSEKQEKDSLIRKQISIQIRERFPFIPGHDAIMASLLIDLGDCYANTTSIEYAKAVYQVAKQYYGERSPALDEKIKEMQKLINKYVSIKPDTKRTEKYEGEKEKIGSMSYKQILDDNDKNNYQVDWSKINFDVKSLLAMVDFTNSVPSNNSDKQKDEFKVVAEKTDTVINSNHFLSANKSIFTEDLLFTIYTTGKYFAFLIWGLLLILLSTQIFKRNYQGVKVSSLYLINSITFVLAWGLVVRLALIVMAPIAETKEKSIELLRNQADHFFSNNIIFTMTVTFTLTVINVLYLKYFAKTGLLKHTLILFVADLATLSLASYISSEWYYQGLLQEIYRHFI